MAKSKGAKRTSPAAAALSSSDNSDDDEGDEVVSNASSNVDGDDDAAGNNANVDNDQEDDVERNNAERIEPNVRFSIQDETKRNLDPDSIKCLDDCGKKTMVQIHPTVVPMLGSHCWNKGTKCIQLKTAGDNHNDAHLDVMLEIANNMSMDVFNINRELHETAIKQNTLGTDVKLTFGPGERVSATNCVSDIFFGRRKIISRLLFFLMTCQAPKKDFNQLDDIDKRRFCPRKKMAMDTKHAGGINEDEELLAFYPRPGPDYDKDWFDTFLNEEGGKELFAMNLMDPEKKDEFADWAGFKTQWEKEKKKFKKETTECQKYRTLLTCKCKFANDESVWCSATEGLQRSGGMIMTLTGLCIDTTTGDLKNELTYHDFKEAGLMSQVEDTNTLPDIQRAISAALINPENSIMNRLIPVEAFWVSKSTAKASDIVEARKRESCNHSKMKRMSSSRGAMATLADSCFQAFGSINVGNSNNLYYDRGATWSNVTKEMCEVPTFTAKKVTEMNKEWTDAVAKAQDDEVPFDRSEQQKKIYKTCGLFDHPTIQNYIKQPHNSAYLAATVNLLESEPHPDPTVRDLPQAGENLRIAPMHAVTTSSNVEGPLNPKTRMLTGENCNEIVAFPLILTALYAATGNKSDEERRNLIEYYLKWHVNSKCDASFCDLVMVPFKDVFLQPVLQIGAAAKYMPSQPVLGASQLLSTMLNAINACFCDDPEQTPDERTAAYTSSLKYFSTFLEALEAGKGTEPIEDQIEVLGEFDQFNRIAIYCRFAHMCTRYLFLCVKKNIR